MEEKTYGGYTAKQIYKAITMRCQMVPIGPTISVRRRREEIFEGAVPALLDALETAEAELEEVRNRTQQAVEAAYMQGHNDTVGGCYGDDIQNALEIGRQEAAEFEYATGMSTVEPINWKRRAEAVEAALAIIWKWVYCYAEDYAYSPEENLLHEIAITILDAEKTGKR